MIKTPAPGGPWQASLHLSGSASSNWPEHLGLLMWNLHLLEAVFHMRRRFQPCRLLSVKETLPQTELD